MSVTDSQGNLVNKAAIRMNMVRPVCLFVHPRVCVVEFIALDRHPIHPRLAFTPRHATGGG